MMEEIKLEQALARAVLCRSLKLGFSPPTEESLRELLSQEGRQVLRQASLAVDNAGLKGITQASGALSCLPETPFSEIRELYEKLFGHTARGRVCPYETEFGGDTLFQQSQELADIRGSYLAFGLEPRESAGERVDHIAVEWEYLEFLAEKEAYAIEREDVLMLDETRKAYRSFLRDHLSRFGPAFALNLITEDPHGLYGALGIVCQAFIGLECSRLGISVGPQFLALRPESLDDAPMACGSSSELVQIE